MKKLLPTISILLAASVNATQLSQEHNKQDAQFNPQQWQQINLYDDVLWNGKFDDVELDDADVVSPFDTTTHKNMAKKMTAAESKRLCDIALENIARKMDEQFSAIAGDVLVKFSPINPIKQFASEEDFAHNLESCIMEKFEQTITEEFQKQHLLIDYLKETLSLKVYGMYMDYYEKIIEYAKDTSKIALRTASKTDVFLAKNLCNFTTYLRRTSIQSSLYYAIKNGSLIGDIMQKSTNEVLAVLEHMPISESDQINHKANVYDLFKNKFSVIHFSQLANFICRFGAENAKKMLCLESASFISMLHDSYRPLNHSNPAINMTIIEKILESSRKSVCLNHGFFKSLLSTFSHKDSDSVFDLLFIIARDKNSLDYLMQCFEDCTFHLLDGFFILFIFRILAEKNAYLHKIPSIVKHIIAESRCYDKWFQSSFYSSDGYSMQYFYENYETLCESLDTSTAEEFVCNLQQAFFGIVF